MDWDLKLGRMIEEDGAAPLEGLQRSPAGARRRRTPSSSTAQGGGGSQPVTCLVDGCTWDLNSCREYHRRHRVCERHSKTPVVLVAGQEQRFCQQCSRFHYLGEFDEAKRSCRKRLDGHNRRRRKTQPESVYINSASGPGLTATASTPMTTLFPAPPPPPSVFHHPLMYPPSAAAWPVAAPPPPYPPPTLPTAHSSPFGYVGRHRRSEGAAEVGCRSDGQIDCALSLLSSGTHAQRRQQQGFHGGPCTSSAAPCYEGFDDHDGDGAACRMLPFSWD